MINALREFQNVRDSERDFGLRSNADMRAQESSGLQNQLARFQMTQMQQQAERENQKRNMLAQYAATGNPNLLAQIDPKLAMQQQQMGQRSQMMRDQMMSRERIAQGRMNQPQWDSARGVWIQPPGAGTVGGAMRPAGLPPSAGEMKKQEADKQLSQTMDTYVAARDGLMSGLKNTVQGPVLGRLPAMSSNAQIAEGGVSAMAPVLKQLFRSAGEGTFTDKDQEILLNMLPTRTDRPDAAKAKMDNIDKIIAAKLGMPVQSSKASNAGKPSAPNSSIDALLEKYK